MKQNKVKCLLDLQNLVEINAAKIHFLADFFSHSILDDEFFSKRGIFGLHQILRGIEDELDLVIDELSIMRRRSDGDSKES